MDPAIVGALAAVLGSLAGGSATVAAGWVTQRTQGRRELIQEDIREREQLYSEFIGECSKRLIDALYHTFEEPQKLGKAYELLNRIRLLASDAVLAEAERVVRRMTEQYFEPNLSPRTSARSSRRRAAIRCGRSARRAQGDARALLEALRENDLDPRPRRTAPGSARDRGRRARGADARHRNRRVVASRRPDSGGASRSCW